MLELRIENRLRLLEHHGFKVLKLRTPGNNGVMDRMILWPKRCPRAPTFVELKAPGKKPRLLQVCIANDWRERGCDVREYCDTYEKVDALVGAMVEEANNEKSHSHNHI